MRSLVFSIAFVVTICAAAAAQSSYPVSIQLVSPAAGSTVSTPVRFAASAKSGCPKGIAAIRLYKDDQTVTTLSGGTFDQSISLSSGTYRMVFVAWDYCYDVNRVAFGLTVTSSGSGSTLLSIKKISPTASTLTSPVRFAAQAATPCSKGVAAMRLYLNDQAVDTVSGGTFDKSVSLQPGSYRAVFVAWDYCTKVTNLAAILSVGGTTAQPHSVALVWQPSTTPGVTYNVYRSIQSSAGYQMVASVLPTTYFTDTTVQAGTTYYYVVRAQDSTGKESSYSNQAVATVPYP